jgi:hypothetical protein
MYKVNISAVTTFNLKTRPNTQQNVRSKPSLERECVKHGIEYKRQSKNEQIFAESKKKSITRGLTNTLQ